MKAYFVKIERIVIENKLTSLFYDFNLKRFTVFNGKVGNQVTFEKSEAERIAKGCGEKDAAIETYYFTRTPKE